jgi:hypothetical protein
MYYFHTIANLIFWFILGFLSGMMILGLAGFADLSSSTGHPYLILIVMIILTSIGIHLSDKWSKDWI